MTEAERQARRAEREERRERAAEMMPWTGKPRAADIAILLGITVSGYYYLALLPATPGLIGTHPVLLELLGGTLPAMVAAGAFVRVGRSSLLLAIAAGVPGLMTFDPLYWWAGHRWGPKSATFYLGRSERARRRLARAERLFERFGWLAILLCYFIPIPALIIDAMAGWTGMSFRKFLAIDIIGALLRTSVLVALGYSIGQGVVNVAKAISHYTLIGTVALIVVIIAVQVWRSRRGPGEAETPAVDAAAAPPAGER